MGCGFLDRCDGGLADLLLVHKRHETADYPSQQLLRELSWFRLTKKGGRALAQLSQLGQSNSQMSRFSGTVGTI
jgi:hypothetical protein